MNALTPKQAAIHGKNSARLAKLMEVEPQAQMPGDDLPDLMALAKRLKRSDELAFLSALQSQMVMASVRTTPRPGA